VEQSGKLSQKGNYFTHQKELVLESEIYALEFGLAQNTFL
jgi:hypothetical protein